MASLSIIEAAKFIQGSLDPSAEAVAEKVIEGVNTLVDAGPDQLSFLSNKRYRSELQQTEAAAVILDRNQEAPDHLAVIRVDDPYLAFARLQNHFHPRRSSSGERHPSAVIDASAKLADDVEVGANAVISAGVSIGSGSIIGAGCHVGERTRIGSNCTLNANSVVMHDCVLGDRVILQPGATIGADGFGYAWDGEGYLKIPQSGRVLLGDDVEIGANATVDRGAIGDTVLERGVKLDNLVQIAHNVHVGAYTVMASQVGISGSTKIGKGCQLGGQSGTAGHLEIGDGCRLAGKTGVIGDLEAGGVYAGIPAMPHRMWLKISALLMKLPEMMKGQQNQ